MHTAPLVLVRSHSQIQIGCDDASVVVELPDSVDRDGLVQLLRQLEQPDQLAQPHMRSAAEELGLDEASISRIFDAVARRSIAPEPLVPNGFAVRVFGNGQVAYGLMAAIKGTQLTARHSKRRPDIRSRPWTESLVVLADAHAPDPMVVSTLMTRRIAHLPVRCVDGRGIVGPLVLPGVTSCLHCANLHRQDLDPEWATVSAQLTEYSGVASRATVTATIGVVLGQIDEILAAFDDPGTLPAAVQSCVEVSLHPLRIVARPQPPHPFCHCFTARI